MHYPPPMRHPTVPAGRGWIARLRRMFGGDLERERLRVLQTVRSRFALEAEEPGGVGRVDDVLVQIEHHAGTRPSAVHANLPYPMDLGMELRSRAGSAAGLSAVLEGSSSLRARDPELDARFSLHAEDSERAIRLLTSAVRQAMIAASAIGRVLIDDRGVSLEETTRDDAWFERAVPAAVQLATLLDVARVYVPVRRALTHLASRFESLANARGLRYSATPLMLVGAREGIAYQLGVFESSRSRAAHVALEVELAALRTLDTATCAQLRDDPEVEAALVGQLELELTRGRMVVRSLRPAEEVAHVEAVLDRGLDVALLLARASSAGHAGPYRARG